MVVRRNLSSDLKFKQRRLREGMRVYSLNGERESKLKFSGGVDFWLSLVKRIMFYWEQLLRLRGEMVIDGNYSFESINN
jgi:hypothetical protein